MKNARQLKLFTLATGILLAVGTLGLPAAGPAIGMAVTNGSFEVNHAKVLGNTTLFDGSLIETAGAVSQLQLNSGALMRLSAESRATVYGRRMVLEAGYGELESAGGYEVEARSLHISAAAPSTLARVRLEGDRKVIVGAVRGSVRVTNAQGLLVASVAAGNSLDFEPQDAGATAPTHATGCLLFKSGRAILADQTTNVVLELAGFGLAAEFGNRVEITGITENTLTSVMGAAHVVKVAAVKHLSKGGCSAVAKKLAASTVAAGAVTAAAGAGAAGAGAAGAAGAAGVAGAAGAAAAGIGAGTVAIVGGVAAAATVGGLAATGSLPGQSDSAPAASR